MDEEVASTEDLKSRLSVSRMLLAYGGSLCDADRLILRALQKSETSSDKSLLNQISLWSLARQHTGSLFRDSFNEIEVILTTERLQCSIKHLYASWDGDHSDIVEKCAPSLKHLSLIYDPEFLLPVLTNIIRNNYAEPKSLIDSGAIGYLIVCLALEPKLKGASIYALTSFLYAVESSSYRERDIVRMFLYKLLIPLCEAQNEEVRLTGPVVIGIAQTLAVVANPAHFLYYKAVRYISSVQWIDYSEIPVYKGIMSFEASSETDRELKWLLMIVMSGLKTRADIDLLQRFYVFENLQSLESNPFLNKSSRVLLRQLLIKYWRVSNRLLVRTQ
ncbi:uncharacterized protein V1510DRAFT_186992 [Dipodascopsis tothii]|uniref:uncharacterized protein n=1 Tax=Dipodascopsis tothii TaxID=44089 RepID=UPI0034CE1AAD